MITMEKLTSILFFMLALTISSCTDSNELTPQTWSEQRFTLTSEQSIRSTSEAIHSAAAFVFQDGKLINAYPTLAMQNSTCSVPVVRGVEVYFVANLGAEHLTAATAGMTLADFLALTYTNANETTFFLSGNTTITSLSSNITISLTRSVASFNLDTYRDEDMVVSNITFKSLPTSTTIWSNEMVPVALGLKEVELMYNTPIGSTEDIFRCYESATPVRIIVEAIYQGIPTIVHMTVPSLMRNHKYTIKLAGVGETIITDFEITPWQDGDDIVANPDETKTIKLDDLHSTYTEAVMIDVDNNKVVVSADGAAFKLAFAVDMSVELVQAMGLTDNITFTPVGTTIADGKVISSFDVEIPPQGIGRLSYQIDLQMKRSVNTHSYDYFTIHVNEHPKQIETATFGSTTWMAFNATAPAYESQIYLADGETLEEKYRLNWLSTIGPLFQWGRKHPYTPWLSGTHNAGGQAQSSGWAAETHIPCPPGFRVPSKAELDALLPPNQEVPGTYTYNGETISIALHNAVPSTFTINGVNGTARYISLTSSTGQTMYIPHSGQKGDKSTTNNPSFGSGFTLWTNGLVAATGGWARVSRFWPGTTATSGTLGDNIQLQREGYASLRCIKAN